MKNLAFMISMLFVVAGCSAEKNETKQETLADRVLNVKVAEAKPEASKTTTVQKSYEHRSYSDDDLGALFDNLDDIEI